MSKSRYYIKVERSVEVKAESYDEALKLYLSGEADIDRLSNIKLIDAFPVNINFENLG
jgi:hypothetical protein